MGRRERLPHTGKQGLQKEPSRKCPRIGEYRNSRVLRVEAPDGNGAQIAADHSGDQHRQPDLVDKRSLPGEDYYRQCVNRAGAEHADSAGGMHVQVGRDEVERDHQDAHPGPEIASIGRNDDLSDQQPGERGIAMALAFRRELTKPRRRRENRGCDEQKPRNKVGKR